MDTVDQNTESFSMPPLGANADFSSLSLSDISPRKKVRTPRKILHFSDGTLEEYSTDEEEEEQKKMDIPSTLDPKSLPWGLWMAYWAQHSGSSILSTCDYVGEGLANFLGITSPKYFYEIEDFKRSLKEEEDEKNEVAAQMAGWTTGSDEISMPPDILIQAELSPSEKEYELRKDFKNIPISGESQIPVLANGDSMEGNFTKY